MADFNEDITDKELQPGALADPWVGYEEGTTPVGGGGEKTEIGSRYPLIQILSGPQEGLSVSLVPGENLIGRAFESRIVLKDTSISRRHAVIRYDAETQRLTVRDLGSHNGTSVNGTKVVPDSELLLAHRDRLSVGIYRLRLLIEPLPQEEEEERKEPHGETGKAAAVPFSPAEEPALAGESGSEETPTPHTPHTPQPIASVLKTIPDELSQSRSISGLSELSELTDSGFSLSRYKGLILGGTIALFFALLIGGAWFYYQRQSQAPSEAPNSPLAEAEEDSASAPAPETPAPEASPPSSEDTLPPADGHFQTVPAIEPPASATVTSVFIEVETRPLPAEIVFGERSLGTAPVSDNIDVELGKSYPLIARFSLPELGEVFETRGEIAVNPGEDRLSLKVDAALATVKFAELPKETAVYLEAIFDHDPGRTRSIKLEEVVYGKPIYLPYGQYILELRGIPKVRPEGPVEAGEEILYRSQFALFAAHGLETIAIPESFLTVFPAHIETTPPDAEIYYDGKRVGETPWDGDLPLGKHSLKIEKQGFTPYVQEIALWRHERQTVAVTLKTSEAGALIFEAKAAVDRRAYEKAVNLLSSALEKSPTESEKLDIYYYLGESYRALDACDKANNYYNKARTAKRYTYKADIGLAACSHKLGADTQALLYLSEVLLRGNAKAERAEAESLFHDVTPIRSVIYLNSTPPEASIWVNGKAIADTTPVLLTDLGIGTYRVTVRKTGYADEELKLHLKLSDFRPIAVELKPLQ